jgi:hypothetical protein
LLDDNGAFFVDRNPKTFALILEMLRTGVLFWESQESLRQLMIEADFFLLTKQFRTALCPIPSGLYTVQGGADSSHPWVVFIETIHDSSRFAPCEVLLTGVVDEEVFFFIMIS